MKTKKSGSGGVLYTSIFFSVNSNHPADADNAIANFINLFFILVLLDLKMFGNNISYCTKRRKTSHLSSRGMELKNISQGQSPREISVSSIPREDKCDVSQFMSVMTILSYVDPRYLTRSAIFPPIMSCDPYQPIRRQYLIKTNGHHFEMQ